ncbi:MAG: trimethylamine methyltransferase family protein, partial [Pseudomonadota bacterium]
MSARRRRTKGSSDRIGQLRQPDYRNLKNPFTPQTVFSDDEVENIHQTALKVLEELGMRVLLKEARELFRNAGARVDEDEQMVFIGREIVEEALRTAPKRIEILGITPEYNVTMEQGALVFLGGGGCPNTTNRVRGRKPGTMEDLSELMKLTDSFDVMHTLNAAVEPQEVPVELRHLHTMQLQTMVSDKIPFLYCRGTGQVEDCFRMMAIARGISREEFEQNCWVKTIINTNSPRQLDLPMGQGIIDFARAGQLSIITPFCLSGAMAPITVAGGLVLQHSEALLGITLSQLAKPGAPVMYGSFASNVDMKSGAPALGTPSHIRSTLGSGQLARRIGLPWRSGGGSAANCNDAQAAHETEMAMWAAVLAGATFIVHSTGWLEGGLSLSYEKFITDMEMVQQFAELCSKTPADTEACG